MTIKEKSKRRSYRMADKKKNYSELSKEVSQLRRKVRDLRTIERKCLQERILLRTLINNLPDAIYAKDASCRKTIANLADVHNMGLHSETDVLGKDDFELFPKEIAEKFYADDKSVIQSGTPVLNREEYFVDAEGKKRWLETSKLPLKDQRGKIVGLIGIGRDITERKQAEEQVRLQLSVIAEQNLELEKARDQAMEANKTKSAFLASMSHELRTPLNAIIGYSEMICEEMSDDGETRYRSDLDRIHMAGKNLLELINEVLDLSKIEAGKMELYVEEFQLSGLIDEVVSTVQPLMEKNENILLVNVAKEVTTVRLDLTKIRQILFNLISNASKFTQHGKITLGAYAVPADGTEGEKIVLKVSDTGIGLTEEQKAKLFRDFTQADGSTTRKYGGTGLGLAISKRFSDMMKGSIDVDSVPNCGTTFTVTLPRFLEHMGEKSPQTKVSAEKQAAPTAANTAVLIIDDDPGVRDLLSRYLSKEGYPIECVTCGEDGIKRAREILPMAIILDVMMPRKDGWAVLQEIKSDPVLQSIPVIMYSMLDEKNFGLAIGASEYLMKPVSKEKILEVLSKYKQAAPSEYILVVDDNADLRAMASRAIQKAGWEVRTAENGRSAIAHLERGVPSIIFLDIMMPVMDGFEFLTIFQNRADWRNIPVVVITSKDLIAEERRQLNGVVKKVIQKGDFTPDRMLKQISSLIPQLIVQHFPQTGTANG
jgi:PAS domain S-box-containing protein